jgi:hypothetical protein
MGPSPSVRLFGLRLRLAAKVYAFIRGFDASDALTVLSLVFIFVGLALPSWAFAVTGGLLCLLTPIGGALRVLIRGR